MARWLRVGLVVVVVGLVGLLVGVEFAGRVVTERVAERQLRDGGVGGSVEVSMGTSWWHPSFLSAVMTGNLDRISVELDRASLYSVPVLRADYVLEDVRVEISATDRTIRVASIGSGKVRLLIDPAEIGRMMGSEATVVDGRIVVGPDRSPADLRIVGDELVLSGPSIATGAGAGSYRVADPELLPCTPDVRVRSSLVELSCTGDQLPGILAQPLGLSGRSTVQPPTELEPPLTLDAPTASSPTTTAAGPTTTTPLGGDDGGG